MRDFEASADAYLSQLPKDIEGDPVLQRSSIDSHAGATIGGRRNARGAWRSLKCIAIPQSWPRAPSRRKDGELGCTSPARAGPEPGSAPCRLSIGRRDAPPPCAEASRCGRLRTPARLRWDLGSCNIRSHCWPSGEVLQTPLPSLCGRGWSLPGSPCARCTYRRGRSYGRAQGR